jgi:hypothetical protein
MPQPATPENIMTMLEVMNTRITELQRLLEPDKKWISRQEIIATHKETWYNNAVKCGGITPHKQKGRTATVYVDRAEYERYLKSITL